MPKPYSNLILILLAASYGLWNLYRGGFLDTLIYDTCSIEYANIKVEQMLNSSQNNKKLQEANAKLDGFLSNSEIPADQKLDAKKDMLRYSWFIKNKQCPMPGAVESAFFHWTLPSDQSGVKDCPDDFYLKEAEAGVEELYKYEQEIADIEKEALSSILEGSQGHGKTIELINKKWESLEFRQSALIAALQISEREKQGCRYPDKPLQSLVSQLLKDYR